MKIPNIQPSTFIQPKQLVPVALFASVAIAVLLTGGTAESEQPRTNLSNTSSLAQAAANLPAQPFPVPGWLGFATVPPKGKHRFVWSPSHRDGQLVIFSEDWAKVKPGTRLVALAPRVKQEVTFVRSSKEPYGCDGIPTAMASFSAKVQPPEGVVWVLPPTAASNVTAISVLEQSLDKVPTTLLPANQRQRSRARAWRAGPATILLQKQGKSKVKLTLAMSDRAIFTQQEEKYSFGEAGKEPIDLSKDFEPGIPQPIGAFQFKANGTPVIVLWVPGYEGNSFELLVPQGNTVKRFEGGSMYFCGY
jgi:hypothetical protein